MTTTDERPSNYHPVDPEIGRSAASKASAKAAAAADGETAADAGLRAQPRAGARAKRSVAAAGSAVRERTEQRRAAVRSRGSGTTTAGEARPSLWEAQLPSLAELFGRATAGPTRAVRLPDGTIKEESADWPDWQVIAWKVYAVAETLLLAAPAYALLYCAERPGRGGALFALITLVVFLGWYGGEVNLPEAPIVSGGGG